MDIILYTVDCPKCKILEKKMQAKQISYVACHDEKAMKEKQIEFLPALEIDGKLFDFKKSIEWINGVI